MTTTRTPVANRFQPIDPQPDALPMPNQTDKTLAQIRTELLTTFSAANWVSYSHLVGWLRDTDCIARVEGRRHRARLPPARRRRPSPLLRAAAPQRTPRPEFLPMRLSGLQPLALLQSIPDRYFSDARCDSVGVIATRSGRGTDDDGDFDRDIASG